MGKKRLIAFSLIMVLLLMFIMSSTVFATGFAKDYIEPFDAEKNYVTIDDNVPVRKSPK